MKQKRGALAFIRSERGRLLRFIGTGGLAGGFQLAMLGLMMRCGWNVDNAEIGAFLLAAQVNFVCSSLFTWRDRAVGGPVWRRWLAFHGSIAGMALVNFAVYELARQAMPLLVASAAGIAVAAAGNFVIGDRLIFRPQRTKVAYCSKVVRTSAM